MKRPALYILLFAVIGVLFGVNSASGFTALIFIVVILALSAFMIFLYKSFSCCFLIVPAVILFCISVSASIVPNSDLDCIADTDYPITFNAVVSSKYKQYDDVSVYKVKTTSFSHSNKSFEENINIYVYTDKELVPGDIVNVITRLSLPDIRRNSADYNKALNYKIKKVDYYSYPYSVNVTGHKNSVRSICSAAAEKVKTTVKAIYPQKEAGLLIAMLTGDRLDIDDDIYELYRHAGIVHIIAISGLHISILAGILLFFVSKLGKNLSTGIVMVFLLFYYVFTGGSISVTRAFIMMYIYLIGYIICRRYDMLSSAATACTLMLCINPYYLFDIGFQYSFTAVFAIALGSELLEHLKKRYREKLRPLYEGRYKILMKLSELVFISFIVGIAVKPITIYYFHYVNTADIFVNLIAVALTEFILVLGILSVIAGVIYVKAGVFLGGAVYMLFKAIETASEISVSLPFTFTLPHIPVYAILAIYALYITVFFMLMGKIKNIIPSLLCAVIALSPLFIKYNGFEADFIYVGQGDCTIIRDEGKCYIIDAGSSYYAPKGSTILRQLEYYNIKSVDGIFISHMDYDHMGAVAEIADDIEIKNVYAGKSSAHGDNYNTLLNTAEEYGIDIKEIDAGFSEHLTDKLKLELLYEDKSSADSNNSSAVYRLNYEGRNILFTGDIDSEALEQLADGVNVNADILKVPHHGSENSYSEKFIKAVDPRLAVNFAGYNNGYGHPSPVTVQGYKSLGIPFLSTQGDGMITVRIDDDGIRYKTFYSKFKSLE